MAFDLFMEDSYCSKILKYQSLISTVENLGYKCQLIVLGLVVWVMYTGWRSVDFASGGYLNKGQASWQKYCSISATIGSMFIGRGDVPIPLETV